MGLLDDAIRDHLELKRRHGADPGEVARIEDEALSAARREAAPAAEVEESDADALYDLEDDPLADLPSREAPEPHHEPEPEAVYELALEDVADDPGPEPDPPAAVRAERPAAVRAEPPADAPESDSQATQQYSLGELEAEADRKEAATGQPRPRPTESADTPPGEPGEEDVLEETPEFLQETPEHDRLWFEQKPPKDFDF